MRNLGEFIEALRRRGDLVEVDVPVDPHLELAEIHRRVIAAGGPALLFRNVIGKRFPVATNLFGSRERVELAFGTRPKEFIERVARLPHELLPPSLKKLWGMRDLARQGVRVGFKRQAKAPVLACRIPDADLTQLPALTSWAEDGGPFITLPLVHTPGTKPHPDNLGMYRIQIHDARETGVHFQIGKGGGFHLYEYEQRREDMPLSIYLGGPPALILSAIAPLPENVPELLLASLVAGERLGRTSIAGHPLAAVAEAEFCLVGSVPAGIRRPEGPFGDHYGYYSLRHDYPVFRPQAIYHRHGAIYPATVVGKPRQEDFYIGDYLQELLFPLIPVVMPGVRDLWSYGETGYHALSGVVLKERYGREAMSTAFRILGEGQLALTKFLLCTDQSIDLKNFSKFLAHILARFEPASDLFVISEVSMDTLDYSTKEINKGSKGVMLGLGAARRQLPATVPATLPTQLIRAARVYCPGCLVLEVDTYKNHPDVAAEILKLAVLKEWPLVVLVDNAAKATASDAAFLWTTFTRFEPAADIFANSRGVNRHRLLYELPIVIDARMKPWYPDELFCDPATRATVDQRWREYFPDRPVTMGASDAANLYE